MSVGLVRRSQPPMATVRRFESHPQSAPGDFYVVNGECMSCGAPHVAAPDLIGWNNAEADHCVWKKQPETPEELEQAFAAFRASCISCYRYAGNAPQIMARIGLDYCDQAAPDRKPLFAGEGLPLVTDPVNFRFTQTASQSTSPFSKLIQGVTSWLRHNRQS